MNFALILFLLLVVTFVAWLADRFVFRPHRLRAADAAVAEFDRVGAVALSHSAGPAASSAVCRRTA